MSAARFGSTCFLIFFDFIFLIFSTSAALPHEHHHDHSHSHQIGEKFPDPWGEPSLCNRTLPSYICNSDFLLTNDEVDNLDDKLWKYSSKASCPCRSCKFGRNGLPVTITLHRDDRFPNERQKIQVIADDIRKKWNYGECGNDLVILMTNSNVVASVGERAREVLKNSRFDAILTNRTAFTRSKYEFLRMLIGEVYTTYNKTLPTSTPDYPEINRTRESGSESINRITELKSSFRPHVHAEPREKKPFIIAEEDDNIEAPRKSDYTRAAVVVVSVLASLIILILLGSLMVWYYRTRTGNIDTGIFYRKAKPEVKNSRVIEATRYKPCHQSEDKS
ncbi:uncharacterized protein LOC141849970 isoform X2 [Brevipalpus obovatus]|uniref:uncharacterized protein LOC141849970 isoform X2 n=1 Tax=Brevipalpus obovatus TaxID=246614 RepID=UPI003D9DCCDD